MSTTATTTTHLPAPPVADPRLVTPAVVWVELRDELLGVVREPTALFFSLLMPVLFFAMFVGLFGTEQASSSDVHVGTVRDPSRGAACPPRRSWPRSPTRSASSWR